MFSAGHNALILWMIEAPGGSSVKLDDSYRKNR